VNRPERFRANVFADRKGPGAVFRTSRRRFTAEQLGLSPAILQLS
jgi:Tfp pilus assembly pilus retraction ATPase PilT